MPKHTDAHDGALGKGKALPITELGNPGPIEKVSETDFVNSKDLEEFMHEILTIIVHQDGSENCVEVPMPSVNGLNQPFLRGREQQVKRKYVEALARGRVTKYEQSVPDASRPENIQMVERTALVYPFSVIHDPNPKGREWLKSILSQN